MPSQLTPRLEKRESLANLVRNEDRVLMPMLLERAQTARALWDLSEDEWSREILTLVLTDPWGSATEDFAPDELRSEGKFRDRINQLIGEMIMPRRSEGPRVRIELQDTFISTEQLEQLRQHLGQIPDIVKARLRMHNQVRFVPQRPENYLLTDFSIEVNERFAGAVKNVAVKSGFQLREDPLLIRREGVRDALLRLVQQHCKDGQPTPEFALCFHLQDRETIHILEVSGQAPELGDGSIDGVGFAARGIIPHAHLLKIYLTHPRDLDIAFRANQDHPLLNDLRSDNCEYLIPDDRGEAFRREFRHLLGG